MGGRHRAGERARSADAPAAAMLLDAVELIGAAPDLEDTLRRTAYAARALTGASYAEVALGDPASPGARLTVDGEPAEQAREPGEPEATVTLVAHGTVLGRITVTGPAAAVRSGERGLLERLARLAAPLVGNARAVEETERRRRWLDCAVKVAAALAPTVRTDEAQEQLVAAVRSATAAPLVALLQADRHEDLHWRVVAGDCEDPGRDVEAASRAVIDDVATCGDAGRVVVTRSPAGTATLLVPLPTQVAPAGVLLVEHAHLPAPLDETERELLATFGGQVSLALDRAWALGQRQDLLLTADRDRIARDLHDLVIQRLYAAGLQLQAARSGDRDGLDAAALAGVRHIDTAIRDLRATIFDLGRGLDRSLRDEVRALADEYAGVLGFRPTLRVTGPVDTALAETVADEVLLVLREALSNVARHAHADAVQVELTASAAWFMLRVADDGVGLPPGGGVASGLRNARRRAETHGGVMRTGAVSPHGTSLVWLVPAGR